MMVALDMAVNIMEQVWQATVAVLEDLVTGVEALVSVDMEVAEEDLHLYQVILGVLL